MAHVFGSYEELKRDQGRMDMEDVLLIGAALLSEDERVAAEVRRQYKWFVVDEFQDVSPIQSALLDLWLGGRDEICVVGDPAQTIYSFAGARASYLTDFTTKFPGATNVELVRNYRSTPQVIHAANALLKDSATTSVLLRAQSDPGPELSWREATDEVDEAEAVAEEAEQAAPGRACRCARWPCCSGSTPSPSPSRRRSPRAASPTSSAVRRGSSSARRCVRRWR